MKRTWKIAGIVAAVVVVLLIVVVVIALSRLDAIVHRTVEREGTAQLDLATTLRNANVSVFGGSLSLQGLNIANPEGYTAPNLFELGQVDVGVGYRDLLGEPVRVRSIDINSPGLVIERLPGEGLESLARLNLRDLLDRLDTGETPPGEAEPTKLIIDRLTVTNARVSIRPNFEGLREAYAVTIPDLTLNNIGTADEAQTGAEIGRVAADVATALARRAAESEDLPAELRAVLNGDLNAMLSQYGQKLGAEVRGRVTAGVQDAQTRLREAVGQPGEGSVGDAASDTLQRGTDDARQQLEGARDGLRGLTRPREQPAQ